MLNFLLDQLGILIAMAIIIFFLLPVVLSIWASIAVGTTWLSMIIASVFSGFYLPLIFKLIYRIYERLDDA